jgi:hypothetical protein
LASDDGKLTSRIQIYIVNSVCPGKQFAEANVWLAAATVVATMQIEKAKDDAGNFIIPDVAFAPGVVR